MRNVTHTLALTAVGLAVAGAIWLWQGRVPARVTVRARPPATASAPPANVGAPVPAPDASSDVTVGPAEEVAGDSHPADTADAGRNLPPASPRRIPSPTAAVQSAASPRRENASPPDRPASGSLVGADEARIALSFVGADPIAESAWATAINDPALDPEQRKDLIEDLNEDGFPDPKHVALDDLPLIVNRLSLIEQLAPDAMDDVNAAAFAEAYKDLTNMLAKLMAR